MKLSIRFLMTNKVLGKLAACMALMALGLHAAHAATTETLNCTVDFQIVETLPNQAKWEMCWEPKPGYGYRLSQVIFTPPNGIRTKVLDTIHAAQLFVPYDDNVARYHDISFGVNLALLSAVECPGGRLLTNSTLCLLRQPARYAFKNIATAASAKSNSFALFGFYGVGNYYYTFKYTFLDDGSIEPSVLASGSLERFGGTQLTGWPIGSRIGVNHHHLVIWRMDFDVDGTANNVVERIEFGGSGTDNRNMTVTPLAAETKETNNLNALRFWRVRNSAQNNSDGRSISYEIEPSVTDQLRAQEDFTQNDFYLTQYRAGEELVDNGLVGFVNGETVTDAVLWYGVNFHHVPRGEDDIKMPAHSQGFRIRPRDLTSVVASTPTNTPPVATNPGNQSTAVNTTVNLRVTASDPNAGDVLSYSATGLPAGLSINSTTGVISGTTGATAATTTATVTVSDGRPGGSSSVSFAWSITATGTGGQGTFNAPAALTLSDNAPTQPYPVNINVSGLTGTVSKVSVALKGLTHTYPSDIDIMLVGPAGQKVVLMSDAGGAADINNATLTFDTAATTAVPQNAAIATGTYMPTNYGAADAFPAPAPVEPYATSLSAFNGTAPNGTWKLYLLDDEASDVGQILNGASLTITTGAAPANNPPVANNPGNQSTAVNTAVNLRVVASDPNVGDVLSYSATGLPAGLSINSTTGVISGTTGATAATTTATITVSDGRPGGSSSVSFAWSITATGTGGQGTFNVPGALTISDNAPTQPYPVNINVSGMTGTVSKVALKLNGLTHTYPADIDIMLVGPAGQKVLLMSDAGGAADINNATLTFDTAATVAVPQNAAIATGTYMPTNYGAADAFPAPAPAEPYATSLSVFNGTAANGTWKLYMLDDEASDAGQILNGVSLTVTTN